MTSDDLAKEIASNKREVNNLRLQIQDIMNLAVSNRRHIELFDYFRLYNQVKELIKSEKKRENKLSDMEGRINKLTIDVRNLKINTGE